MASVIVPPLDGKALMLFSLKVNAAAVVEVPPGITPPTLVTLVLKTLAEHKLVCALEKLKGLKNCTATTAATRTTAVTIAVFNQKNL